MWRITSVEGLHTAMLPGEGCQGLLGCSMCIRQSVYHMCLEEWPMGLEGWWCRCWNQSQTIAQLRRKSVAGVNEEESPGKHRDGRTPGKASSVTLDPTRTLTQMENWWRCLWRLLQSRAHFCFTRGKRRSGTHCREVKRSKRPCTQIRNQHL